MIDPTGEDSKNDVNNPVNTVKQITDTIMPDPKQIVTSFGVGQISEVASGVYGAAITYQTGTSIANAETGFASFELGLAANMARQFGGGNGNHHQPKKPKPNVPVPPTTTTSSGGSGIVNIQDPNGLVGPSGCAAQNYVVDGNEFAYEILFANETNATAPAQIVQVVDPLSTNLNWTTFRLTEIAFGSEVISVPPNVQQFQTNLSFSFNGVNLRVEINAGIQLATGQVFANIYCIDPNTGLPPPVGIGFLPPDNTNHVGEGHVSYIVRPNPNLPTGLQISNVAYIQFDQNPAIATDLVNDKDPSQGVDTNKMAIVTIDSTPSVSSVSGLPATVTNTTFDVCWSGTDVASGVVGYDVYVSTNGGSWAPWLVGTTNACASFTGQNGMSYGFYSIAHDGAGNVEATPSAAEATTVVQAAVPAPTGSWVGLGAAPGVNGPVHATALDTNGNLYVGGEFTLAGNIPAMNVAKWNGSAWSALGSGMNSNVLALSIDSSGTLYAGGTFTAAGGATANYVAKWSGSAWSPLGLGMNGNVLALDCDTFGKLYAGGYFTSADGVAANCVAEWNGRNWSALASGINSAVYCLASDSAGNLFAGGLFTSAGGVAATNIAQWDGNSWSALGPGLDSIVKSVACDSSGNLYAGGGSGALGTAPGFVATWSGSAWSVLGPNVNNGGVNALAVDVSGRIYAGIYSLVASEWDYFLAQWTGSAWIPLGTGLRNNNAFGGNSAPAYSLACDNAGNLYAGGFFTTANGVPANNIAEWVLAGTNGNPLVVTNLQPAPNGVAVSFNRPIDPTVLYLYTSATALSAPPDLSVVGDTSGPVMGSLLIGPQTNSLIFVKAGGPFTADAYTVTLRSATNGFKDFQGNLLAGSNGVAGSAFTGRFTNAASPAPAIFVPDFARGPGQPVNVPATTNGIPVVISEGSNVVSASFTLAYDTNLLRITSVSADSSLPAGWTLTTNVVAQGQAAIVVAGATPLGQGPAALAWISAAVPWCAPYGASDGLFIRSVSVNNGGIAAVGDIGVQVVAYLGDVSGDRSYRLEDSTDIASVVTGLASGFSAYPLVAPVLVGDASGDGTLTVYDAELVAQEAQGLVVPSIPNLPLVNLAIAAPTGQVTISWLSCAGNYILQSSSSLGGHAAWTTVTNAASVSGDQNVVVVSISDQARFYRLQSATGP